MSKAILKIDMPDDCLDCLLLQFGGGVYHMKCKACNKFIDRINLMKRPDWCPLKEVKEDDVD